MKHDLDRCMFCLRTDRRFRSDEHVLPESLGNKTMLLAAGVVCDDCNNGPLATCDQALVQCPPLALLKTLQGIRTKRGKLPRLENREGGIFTLEDEGNVYVRVPDAGFVDRGGSYDMQLVCPWTDEKWRRVSRALLKAGFEQLAFDKGKSFVMDERFDGLRKAVRTGDLRGMGGLSRGPDPAVNGSYAEALDSPCFTD